MISCASKGMLRALEALAKPRSNRPRRLRATISRSRKKGRYRLADKAEAARIIDRLLARKNLSSNLREDLAEFKRTLSDGSFDEVDSRYVRALAKRLGV